MHLPPNELYSAFSFIGKRATIHLIALFFLRMMNVARNTGTCLFMIWTGLGCLLQCINSIVWNKNMINRVPVYCDICNSLVAFNPFQVALNAAVPASSLCINRLLYRVASKKSAGTAEDRRFVIIDLLIGVGIPVLQMVLQYIVSENRYNIFEDIGPFFNTQTTLPAFFLFYGWPVLIGYLRSWHLSSLATVMTICAFYKHRRSHMRLSGHNGCRYLRLMAISTTEILGTVPLGHFTSCKMRSWVAGFTWKNDPQMAFGLEVFRWSLVACAFLFFALFGLSFEARERYYRLYKRINRSSALHETPHATPSLPYVKRNGDVTVPIRIMVQTARDKVNSSVSFALTDQPSVLSIPMETIRNSDSTTVEDLHSGAVSSFCTGKSFDEPGMQDAECQSNPPPAILLTGCLASVSPHFLGVPESMMSVHAASQH
ncbi:pheromone A receptor-domain-containing protein [Russula aff. rugulosa BPL654]|nr:pheromone A receptor-domain-containing protein [Russula aff. rugulosa BPL654]